MRVTEPTARKYLDDDTVRDIARRMLFEIVDEQPGADLMEAPRTAPLPVVLVAATVTALAEAMQLRAANEPVDGLGELIVTYGQTLSGLGQITAEPATGPAANVQTQILISARTPSARGPVHHHRRRFGSQRAAYCLTGSPSGTA